MDIRPSDMRPLAPSPVSDPPSDASTRAFPSWLEWLGLVSSMSCVAVLCAVLMPLDPGVLDVPVHAALPGDRD